VIARPAREHFGLSARLWGEARFPLIVLLRGSLTQSSWEEFRDAIGYKPNWRLSGQTYRLLPEKIAASPYRTEEGVLRGLKVTP
jgi:hypothetical protein